MGISKVHPGCSLLFRVRCARKGAPASWPAGSIERGQRKKNPVVPRGTWRLRISIIAGIKARASFLGRVPLSFLPLPGPTLPRSSLKGPFSAHNRDERARAPRTHAGLNRDNFCLTFLWPQHALSSPFLLLLLRFLLLLRSLSSSASLTCSFSFCTFSHSKYQ